MSSNRKRPRALRDKAVCLARARTKARQAPRSSRRPGAPHARRTAASSTAARARMPRCARASEAARRAADLEKHGDRGAVTRTPFQTVARTH